MENPTSVIPQSKNTKFYYDRSFEAWSRGEYDLCLANLNKILEIDSDDAKPYLLRGVLYMHKELYAQAIVDFNTFIGLVPDETLAYTSRGEAHLHRGNYDKAVIDLSKAIELDPTSANSYYRRGLAYLHNDDYDQAISDFDKALELDHDLITVYIDRGVAYHSKGEYDRAIADYNKLLELDPSSAMAYSNRGNTYIAKKNFEQALADCNKAIEIDPDHWRAYHNRGLAYKLLDKFSQAITDFDQTIKLNPGYSEIYVLRGECYSSIENYNLAIDDFSKAIKLNPNSTRAYFRRGFAHSSKGNYKHSVSDFNKVIELDPDNEIAYSQREEDICHLYTSDSEALELLSLRIYPTEETINIAALLGTISESPIEDKIVPVGYIQSIVTRDDWASKLKVALEKRLVSNERDLRAFSRECWEEIRSKRRYQIPSAGRAEIIASDNLKELINLHSIEFIQEGIRAPGVFLRVQFGDNLALGIVKINQDGTTEGFHSRSGDKLFRAIIEAVALSYYRDLVIPGEILYYVPGTKGPKTKSPPYQQPRPLPRPQNVPVPGKPSNKILGRKPNFRIGDWHYALERAKHSVTGHHRWIREGYIASFEKQQQALEFTGFKLPAGYTWVVEHERGRLDIDYLRTENGNLTEKTIFLPPERATQQMKELLWQR